MEIRKVANQGKVMHMVPGHLLLMEKLAKRSIELYYRDESESAVLSCLCDLIQRHLEESNTSPEDGRKYTMRHNKWIQAATAANAILDETALPEKKSAKKGRK